MSKRAFAVALLLLALAGAWACWCDTAMLWDGAYQFCETLISGRPFSYLSRFHSWLAWQPLALVAPHTENYRLLRLLYGLPFCLAPAVGAALSWWVVRQAAPHLAVWVLFGIALAPLPGQIFMINDSIFQLHLFWPVLLAALLPVSRGQAGVIAAVSLFQLSHPMGIGLCLFAAVTSFTVRGRVSWALWLFTLALAGWLKLVVWPDNYAANEATFAQIYNTFVGGVRGWPLGGILAVWAGGAILFFRPRAFGWWLTPLLLAVAGGLWLTWACYPSLWRGAVNYRRWVAPAAFPFMLAIIAETWRPPSTTAGRNCAGILAATIFLAVLGTQAAVTRRLFERMGEATAATPGPWIDASAFPWMRDTALEHWGLVSQVIMVQGRSPHTLLRDADAEAAARRHPPQISLKPLEARDLRNYPASWFRWTGLPGPVPP